MSFASSIEIASSGLSAQRQRMEVLAANLANAKTTRTEDGGPYKKKFVIFSTQSLDPQGRAGFSDTFRRELQKVEVERIVEDQEPPTAMFDPSHPDADEQGYVHYPNVNPVDEMLNLMGAARSYEANLEVMKTVKGLAAATMELAKV
jgi:flagellar basal-body rod protein FlgC